MLKWPLMEGEVEPSGGGGEVTAPPSSSPADPPKQEPSLLAAAASGKPADPAGTKPIVPAIDPATGRPSHVPEKYWNPETKSIRSEEALKSALSLEKRMGDVGLPPETPDGYQFRLPDGTSLDPTAEKEFREQAHKHGLTKKQYEFVLGQYLEATKAQIPEAIASFVEGRRADTEQTLKTQWGAEYDANMNFAVAAFKAFTAPEEQAEVDRIGNNPVMLRILARVGRELSEDKSVTGAESIIATDDLKYMMRGAPGKPDSPYWNPSDPNHARTKAKVQAHHEAIARQKQTREAA